MSSVNYLGILQEHFGISGISIGNQIYRALGARGYKGQYNPLLQNITIENSASLSAERLRSILSAHVEAVGWSPVVIDKRNSNGNLEIQFKCKSTSAGGTQPHFDPDEGDDCVSVPLQTEKRMKKFLSLEEFLEILKEIKVIEYTSETTKTAEVAHQTFEIPYVDSTKTKAYYVQEETYYPPKG